MPEDLSSVQGLGGPGERLEEGPRPGPGGHGDLSWFTEGRFGMFIHWGLYSLAGKDAWYKQQERLSDAEYDKYFREFRADLYDPDKWVSLAKDAGMRYATLTTKHHDGFCLWDSAYTDYKSTRAPAGRDLVADFVTACRAQGLRVGLYHSLLDWHHPEFPLDGLHPQRDDGDKGGRDIRLYREYLHNQVRELVSTYTPDLLWFDFSYPPTWEGGTASPYGGWGGKGRDDWGSAELVSMVRSLAPKALINDRLDLPGSEDYLTPEELTLYATPTRNGVPVPWETCRTMNGSFGYAPSFEDWFEPRGAIRLLVDAVSKDGNLLLNVGPTPRGEIGVREERLLLAVGEWMKRHSPAVYGAGASKVVAPEGCLTTERAGRVYLHFFDWPSSPVVISGLGSRVRYASFLHDGLEVRAEILDYRQLFTPHQRPPGPEGSLAIYLPRKPPEVTVPVVELVLDPVA